jgi:hypothetical protein
VLQTEDGERLHGWWIVAQSDSPGHRLRCQCNAGNVGIRVLDAFRAELAATEFAPTEGCCHSPRVAAFTDIGPAPAVAAKDVSPERRARPRGSGSLSEAYRGSRTPLTARTVDHQTPVPQRDCPVEHRV